MGLSSSTLRLLAMTLGQKRLPRSVLTLGKNGVEGRLEDVQRTAHFIGERLWPRARGRAGHIRHDSLTQFGRSIHQDTVFRMLGFEEAHSIDYFPNEEPTYVLDLNQRLPEALWGRYSLVLDSGTALLYLLALPVLRRLKVKDVSRLRP